MARKKGSAPVAEPAPAVTLEELKKRLIARGKSHGSLTYEEINSAFDVLEEISPEQLEEFFEEITTAGIEIVDEQKDEKPEAEREEEVETDNRRRSLARRSGPDVSQGDRASSAALDGAREVAGDAHRSRRTRAEPGWFGGLEDRRRRRGGQAAVNRGQPSTRRIDREEVRRPRHALLGLDPGRQSRPHPSGRKVRLS